jgi:hypothetical protein
MFIFKAAQMIKRYKFLSIAMLVLTSNVFALEYDQNNLTISKIRAVGDYAGTTYDGTLEIWFSAPLVWPSQFPCSATHNVIINKNNPHLVSAAYMAFAAGKKVNVHVDTDLPIRGGQCEISFIDVIY